MRAKAAEGAVSRTGERKTSTSYALGLLCECGARRYGSRRLCAQCYEATGGIEAATSPWWKESDGVLVRVRGDADVVREIVSLKGL